MVCNGKLHNNRIGCWLFQGDEGVKLFHVGRCRCVLKRVKEDGASSASGRSRGNVGTRHKFVTYYLPISLRNSGPATRSYTLSRRCSTSCCSSCSEWDEPPFIGQGRAGETETEQKTRQLTLSSSFCSWPSFAGYRMLVGVRTVHVHCGSDPAAGSIVY